MDHAEVNVATLPVKEWLERYCVPEKFALACQGCPDYGRVWSCPPELPPASELFAPFERVHLIGMKVVYKKETREAATSPEKTDRLRAATYGKAKRVLLESLLELEKSIPGSWSIAAGRCELCRRCAREDGLPCRMPERLRYSFSGFGFDLTRMASEALGLELLWSPQGLPAYNVAVAALLERGHAGQRYLVDSRRPWQLFQDEVAGVLRQMGCTVRQAQGGRLSVADQATGDTYELLFRPSAPQMELGTKTGSGRRLSRFSQRLQDCFPELTPVKE